MSDLFKKFDELSAKNTDTTAHKRLAMLFDGGMYTELDKFSAKENFGGVITAMGAIEGSTVYAFAQNPEDNLGAMSKLQWKKIEKLYSLAAKTGAPIVAIFDSMGANLKAPAEALTAYRAFVSVQGEISGVVPQIAVIAGNCAGTAAIAACSSDIVIMSEKAKLYMSAPYSDECGSAAFCADNGSVHIVCEDDLMAVAKAKEIISILPANNLCAAPLFNFSDVKPTDAKSNRDIALALSDEHSAIELMAGYTADSYTALATVGGSAAGIIATTGDYIKNCDARKMANFINFCDAFNLPLVVLLDSKGFIKDAGSEERGLLSNAARLSAIFATATTAKIVVITGNAIAGAYTTLTDGDFTIATPCAVISPLETKTAVAFLYEDKITAEFTRENAQKAYEENEASAFTAAAEGLIDMVVKRADIKSTVVEAISALRGKRVVSPAKKHINTPV